MIPYDTTWMPGAHERERFRADVHLRIKSTAHVMSELLNNAANRIFGAVETAAKAGHLHEERAEIEYARVADLGEHERWVYNWASVMLTTRTMDAFRHLTTILDRLLPPHQAKGKSECEKLKQQFRDRCNIDLDTAPNGTGFLDGMVLARNKIVHNAGHLYERSSNPDSIPVEGDEPWQPTLRDEEFLERFPAYTDGDRITVTKELFAQQAEQCLALITYVTAAFDQFVQLLSAPAGTPS